MHNNLFKPDRFSDPVPDYRAAESAVVDEAEHLLAEHFVERTGRIISVDQNGGAEINSKNLKIYTERGLFLLKKTDSSSADANFSTNLDKQLKLLAWLAERGQPVPQPMVSDEGALYVRNGGITWHLLSFIKGGYFSGTAEMIVPAGAAIGRLLNDLRGIPSALTSNHQLPDTRTIDADIINRLRCAPDAWPTLFGDADAKLIKENWDLIIETDHDLEEHWSEMQESRVQPAHMDLHPHNIIMHGNEVAGFLDFDSCRMAPVARAVGFATYKLMRQACARGGESTAIDPAGTTHAFLEALVSEFAMSDRERHILPYQAKAEVMRRLALILRLNLEIQDFGWNWVLPMHLSGLHEIDRLFETAL